MKGWDRACEVVQRFDGSSMKIRSRRSFSWLTFFSWSGGKSWLPTNSLNKSRDGFIVLIVTTLSCKNWTQWWHMIWVRARNKPSLIQNIIIPLTFSVSLSTSWDKKLQFESKCLSLNAAFRTSLFGILPLRSMKNFNICSNNKNDNHTMNAWEWLFSLQLLFNVPDYLCHQGKEFYRCKLRR